MKYVVGFTGALGMGMLTGYLLLEIEGKRRADKVYGKGHWGYWKKPKDPKKVTYVQFH